MSFIVIFISAEASLLPASFSPGRSAAVNLTSYAPILPFPGIQLSIPVSVLKTPGPGRGRLAGFLAVNSTE